MPHGSGSARGCTSTIVRRWPSTTSAPIRAALLLSEDQRCDPHSPCASRRETGRGRLLARLCPLRLGVGAVGDGPTGEAAVADLQNALEALLLAEDRRGPHDQAPVRPDRGASDPRRDFPRLVGRVQRPGSTAPPSCAWIGRRHGAASLLSTARRCCRGSQRGLEEPGDDRAARQVWTELA
jgi:hypothetical protein